MEKNLENSIKDCISNELEKGIVEKVISEQLEGCIKNALKDMFSWNGCIKNAIDEKVKSVMLPVIENYNYSEYIIKLDAIMTEVLKKATKDNKTILENFKSLCNSSVDLEDKKVIKVSELFSKWSEYVEKEVDTSNLDIDYDDGVSYEAVDVSYEFEGNEKESWLKQKSGRIIFRCDQDENMNFCIEVYGWEDMNEEKQYYFRTRGIENLSSLRNLNEFEVYLMALSQGNIKIEIDETYYNDSVIPEKEPEPTYE